MKLSVVIPTYNRKDSLRRTLEGLSRQTFPADGFEAVVVSDGSTDGTEEMVVDYARTAAYSIRVVNQVNGGPSKARNRGVQEAQHDVIVFLDDDVEPVPEFLYRHAMHHERNARVAVVGPMSPDPSQSNHEPVWIAWEHAKLQEIYAMFRPGGTREGHSPGPRIFYSGNASVRREWLLATGGFDESFTRQEDVELAMRMHRTCGLSFHYDFAADGLHRPQRSFEAWLRIPKSYGVFDAQRVNAGLLSWSEVEQNSRKRNIATRALASFCCACPPFLPVFAVLLHRSALLLYRTRNKSSALAALSALYNICYIDAATRSRAVCAKGEYPSVIT